MQDRPCSHGSARKLRSFWFVPLPRAVPGRSAVHWEWLLVPVLGVAALLRFAWIDDQSFWQNELFSVIWVRQSFAFLWGEGMRIETNPPLYYAILKGWIALFGEGVLGARSLSAFAAVASVACVYAVAREIAGTKAGLAAAAMLAISPAQIYFADEARCYALIPLPFGLALLAMFRFLRADGAAAWGWAHLYGLCCVTLIYLHGSGIVLVATAAASLALYAIDQRIGRSRWIIGAYIHALIAIAAVPELVVVAGQYASPNIEWIPRVHPVTLAAMARFWLFGPVPQLQYASGPPSAALWWQSFVALLLFVFIAISARRSHVKPLQITLLALLPCLFFCLLTAVSLARPMMLPRIMIGATVPISVLSGIALTSRLSPRVRATLAAALACMSAIGLAEASFNPAHVKPDWRAMLPLVAERVTAGDIVVVGPHASVLGLAQAPFNLCRAPNVRTWERDPEQATAVSWLEAATCGSKPLTTEALSAQIQSGPKLWLLLDTADEQALAAEPFGPARTRLARSGLTLLSW